MGPHRLTRMQCVANSQSNGSLNVRMRTPNATSMRNSVLVAEMILKMMLRVMMMMIVLTE